MSGSIDVLAAFLGWASFAAWSISFWPQVVLNYQRKSVVGLSFEFLAYNVTAFTFYSVYNLVKLAYASSSVELNNIAFGLHAVLVTVITIVQCFYYKVERQRVHPAHGFICAMLWVIALYTLILGAFKVVPMYSSDNSTFSFVDLLGWIKVFITVVKYAPQAYMNYQRQSTVGWSIVNILLDFSGGIMNLIQTILQGELLDNLVQTAIAAVSILFDVLFLTQHYVLYTNRADPDSGVLGAFEPAGEFDVNKSVVNNGSDASSSSPRQQHQHSSRMSPLLDGASSSSSSSTRFYHDPSTLRPPSYYSTLE